MFLMIRMHMRFKVNLLLENVHSQIYQKDRSENTANIIQMLHTQQSVFLVFSSRHLSYIYLPYTCVIIFMLCEKNPEIIEFCHVC